MAQVKVPDEELNCVTGGSSNSEAASVQVSCSKVDKDTFERYYNPGNQQNENDCPHFFPKSGTFRRCDCCVNLETGSGAAIIGHGLAFWWVP